MTNNYKVIHTVPEDLEMIFGFFDHSIKYQKKHGYPDWQNYDRNAIINDIKDQNQYKIVVDSTPAIVFSVCYSDRIIWREMEKGNAIYLHRIVVNPSFKGQKLFGKIIDWAKEHCKTKHLSYIRMDTWAANPTIISYYQNFGFRIVQNYTTPDTKELPLHNRNLALTLLESPVGI